MALTKTRHLQVRFGNKATPEVFAYKATINTDEDFTIDTQGQDIYTPDPANPDTPRPREHVKTGYSATNTGAGICHLPDWAALQAWALSDEAWNVQVWLGAAGYVPYAVKLTNLSLKGNHENGEDVTFSCTLTSHGTIGAFVSASTEQTYRDVDHILALSGTITLDVNGGSLTDIAGAAIAFTKITEVEISAHGSNTTVLTVGAAVAPFLGPMGSGDTVSLSAGDVLHWRSATGWAVSAGVNDQIKIANASGGAAKYTAVIKGVA